MKCHEEWKDTNGNKWIQKERNGFWINQKTGYETLFHPFAIEIGRHVLRAHDRLAGKKVKKEKKKMRLRLGLSLLLSSAMLNSGCAIPAQGGRDAKCEAMEETLNELIKEIKVLIYRTDTTRVRSLGFCKNFNLDTELNSAQQRQERSIDEK